MNYEFTNFNIKQCLYSCLLSHRASILYSCLLSHRASILYSCLLSHRASILYFHLPSGLVLIWIYFMKTLNVAVSCSGIGMMSQQHILLSGSKAWLMFIEAQNWNWWRIFQGEKTAFTKNIINNLKVLLCLYLVVMIPCSPLSET